VGELVGSWGRISQRSGRITSARSTSIRPCRGDFTSSNDTAYQGASISSTRSGVVFLLLVTNVPVYCSTQWGPFLGIFQTMATIKSRMQVLRRPCQLVNGHRRESHLNRYSNY
jgi:hypothetical protein